MSLEEGLVHGGGAQGGHRLDSAPNPWHDGRKASVRRSSRHSRESRLALRVSPACVRPVLYPNALAGASAAPFGRKESARQSLQDGAEALPC